MIRTPHFFSAIWKLLVEWKLITRNSWLKMIEWAGADVCTFYASEVFFSTYIWTLSVDVVYFLSFLHVTTCHIFIFKYHKHISRHKKMIDRQLRNEDYLTEWDEKRIISETKHTRNWHTANYQFGRRVNHLPAIKIRNHLESEMLSK